MSKMYVLMEIGWQYNDEIYFQSGDNDGRPKKVFDDPDAAQAEVDRKNRDQIEALIRDGALFEYCYDPFDVVSKYGNEEINGNSRIDTLFKEIFNINYEQWCDQKYENWGKHPSQPPDNLSSDKWQELLKCFNLDFWEVVPVEKV